MDIYDYVNESHFDVTVNNDCFLTFDNLDENLGTCINQKFRLLFLG